MTDTQETMDQTNLIRSATKGQSSKILILQTHANALDRQGFVDFSQHEKLIDIQHQFNNVLGKSKERAHHYLNVIQPNAIETIARVDRYFNMQLAFGRLLDQNMERNKLIRSLRTIEEKTVTFQREASDVARQLSTLRTSLSEDAAEYSRLSNKLETIAGADSKLVKELKTEIEDIDGKIAGAISAAALSGVGVAGGVFLVAVGTVAGFVTAGTSTPLAVLGGTLIVGGVAGAVGSGVSLGVLAGKKQELLQQQEDLKAEVLFAQGMQSNFNFLAEGASGSASAAQDMANAWDGLTGHLKNLADDLEAGRRDIDLIDLYALTAEEDIKDIKGDINIIKRQLAGASVMDDEQLSLADMVAKASGLANDNSVNQIAA